MIHIIEGDLFATNADVICHQVNCQGVMGSGVAKQVKEKYPKAYEKYKATCDDYWCSDEENFLLGIAQIVKIDNKNLANLFCQFDYGYNGVRYTDYEAVYKAFTRLNENCPQDFTFAFPYHFGCDRGGADWGIILKMMEVVFKDREVFIYKLK